MAKKKKKKGGKKSRAAKVQLVVASRVKDVVRSAGLRSDGQLADAVNQKVLALLNAAVERTGANRRGTVRPHDL